MVDPPEVSSATHRQKLPRELRGLQTDLRDSQDKSVHTSLESDVNLITPEKKRSTRSSSDSKPSSRSNASGNNRTSSGRIVRKVDIYSPVQPPHHINRGSRDRVSAYSSSRNIISNRYPKRHASRGPSDDRLKRETRPTRRRSYVLYSDSESETDSFPDESEHTEENEVPSRTQPTRAVYARRGRNRYYSEVETSASENDSDNDSLISQDIAVTPKKSAKTSSRMSRRMNSADWAAESMNPTKSSSASDSPSPDINEGEDSLKGPRKDKKKAQKDDETEDNDDQDDRGHQTQEEMENDVHVANPVDSDGKSELEKEVSEYDVASDESDQDFEASADVSDDDAVDTVQDSPLDQRANRRSGGRAVRESSYANERYPLRPRRQVSRPSSVEVHGSSRFAERSSRSSKAREGGSRYYFREKITPVDHYTVTSFRSSGDGSRSYPLRRSSRASRYHEQQYNLRRSSRLMGLESDSQVVTDTRSSRYRDTESEGTDLSEPGAWPPSFRRRSSHHLPREDNRGGPSRTDRLTSDNEDSEGSTSSLDGSDVTDDSLRGFSEQFPKKRPFGTQGKKSSSKRKEKRRGSESDSSDGSSSSSSSSSNSSSDSSNSDDSLSGESLRSIGSLKVPKKRIGFKSTESDGDSDSMDDVWWTDEEGENGDKARAKGSKARAPPTDMDFGSVPAGGEDIANRLANLCTPAAVDATKNVQEEPGTQKINLTKHHPLPISLAVEGDESPITPGSASFFRNIGGLDKQLFALQEMVTLPLLYPELFRNLAIRPPRGVLFHGPPGTGKTLVARSLASLGIVAGKKISLFVRKGADILSKWVGEAEKQLRLLFESAQYHAPSIIFLDELDGLAPARTGRQDQMHVSIVSTLLALMDGLEDRGDVIVIGATNIPDSLDEALRRPGRFDRELKFELPNDDARGKILDIHTRNFKKPLAPELREFLIAQTNNFCGADIKALCTEASLLAIRRSLPQIYPSLSRLDIPQSRIDEIEVIKQDFLAALVVLNPSTQRKVSSVHGGPNLITPSYSDPVSNPPIDALLSSRVEAVFNRMVKCMPHLKGKLRGAMQSLVLQETTGESMEAVPVASNSSSSEQNSSLVNPITPSFHDATPARVTLQPKSTTSGMDLTQLLPPVAVPSCYRPRLLVYASDPGKASPSSGAASSTSDLTNYVVRSLLSRLDNVTVVSVTWQLLYTDPREPNPLLVLRQSIMRASQSTPSVLYVPNVDTLWNTIDETLQRCFVELIESLPANLPMFLLATLSSPAHLPKPSAADGSALSRITAEATSLPPPLRKLLGINTSVSKPPTNTDFHSFLANNGSSLLLGTNHTFLDSAANTATKPVPSTSSRNVLPLSLSLAPFTFEELHLFFGPIWQHVYPPPEFVISRERRAQIRAYPISKSHIQCWIDFILSEVPVGAGGSHGHHQQEVDLFRNEARSDSTYGGAQNSNVPLKYRSLSIEVSAPDATMKCAEERLLQDLTTWKHRFLAHKTMLEKQTFAKAAASNKPMDGGAPQPSLFFVDFMLHLLSLLETSTHKQVATLKRTTVFPQAPTPPPALPPPLSSEELRKIEQREEKYLSVLRIMLRSIVDEFSKNSKFRPFATPVDPEIAPDYYTIIKEPVDFMTISDKITAGAYIDYDDFVQDLIQIRENAKLYNPVNFQHMRSMYIRRICDHLRDESDCMARDFNRRQGGKFLERCKEIKRQRAARGLVPSRNEYLLWGFPPNVTPPLKSLEKAGEIGRASMSRRLGRKKRYLCELYAQIKKEKELKDIEKQKRREEKRLRKLKRREERQAKRALLAEGCELAGEEDHEDALNSASVMAEDDSVLGDLTSADPLKAGEDSNHELQNGEVSASADVPGHSVSVSNDGAEADEVGIGNAVHNSHGKESQEIHSWNVPKANFTVTTVSSRESTPSKSILPGGDDINMTESSKVLTSSPSVNLLSRTIGQETATIGIKRSRCLSDSQDQETSSSPMIGGSLETRGNMISDSTISGDTLFLNQTPSPIYSIKSYNDSNHSVLSVLTPELIIGELENAVYINDVYEEYQSVSQDLFRKLLTNAHGASVERLLQMFTAISQHVYDTKHNISIHSTEKLFVHVTNSISMDAGILNTESSDRSALLHPFYGPVPPKAQCRSPHENDPILLNSSSSISRNLDELYNKFSQPLVQYSTIEQNIQLLHKLHNDISYWESN